MEAMAQVTTYTPAQVQARLNDADVQIVDIRDIRELADGTVATVLSMVPFSAPIMMPLRLGLADVPTRQVVVSVGVLSLTTVACLMAAGRVYRTALLMYGKRPSLAEITRWMRAAD